MDKYKLMMFLLIIISFIGCNSLPKNVAREEYNSVRDHVSMNIAGLTYSELLSRLSRQKPPQYYPDGGLFDLPYYKEEPGSNFSEYNNYLMEISNKMNQLVDGYGRTDQVESFYSWAIRKYDDY
jgi:hypothetical protein